MTAAKEPLIVFTNLPDRATALELARKLVEQRVAACVNVLGEISSVYRWKGEVTSEKEVAILIKTTSVRFDELATAIKSMHPYELPEIIAVPVAYGLPAYLDWVAAETEG
jgi:periplasmic divalent cation tolerance protein